MNRLLIKRGLGLFFLAFGTFSVFFLKNAYHAHRHVDGNTVIPTPVILLYGIVVTMSPNVMKLRGESKESVHPFSNAIQAAVIIVGLTIGAWLLHTYFRVAR